MVRRINAIDIETFGSEKLTPYCFSVIYSNRARTAYGLGCVSRGLAWIFSNCSSGSIFFAHNLNFDGSIILSNLVNNVALEGGGTILHGGDIYSLTLSNQNRRIILRCSAKILPLDLSGIATLLKLPPKLEFAHTHVGIDTVGDPAFRSRAIRYCERDASLVHKFMTKIGFSISPMIPRWWESAFSVSGIAIKVYRLNFNTHNIPLSLSREIDELVRPAYYGGRCEVFGNPVAGEYIFHFDFSGMYTNRLKEPFPLGAARVNTNPSGFTHPGFYFVTVQSNLGLPILPFRDLITGKLTFPNGSFGGLYWHEELLLFIERGGIIISTRYSIEFDQTGYVFKDFAEACSRLRVDDLASNVIWKLIPNSFVGRLGLKPSKEKTLLIDDIDYDPTKIEGLLGDKKINNKWLVRVVDPTSPNKINGNVIYPAIVTAKARILWWKSAKAVEENGGRLFYCDTDSIFAGFGRDVSNETHGDIFWDASKNDTVILDACFATSKVYCVKYRHGDHTKIKGVTAKELGNMTMHTFKDLFYNSKKDSIKMTLFNKNFLDMRITEINKIIDFGGYDKRIFNSDKTTTTPLVIK